jgi:hypothetical protein
MLHYVPGEFPVFKEIRELLTLTPNRWLESLAISPFLSQLSKAIQMQLKAQTGIGGERSWTENACVASSLRALSGAVLHV